MKKGFEEVVAWQYDGRTAIGILYSEFSNHYVSVAVNYFMDSSIRAGDLWIMDDIHKDDDTEIRLARNEEIQELIKALEYWNIPYEYDKDTRTIRNFNAYPTRWMRFMKWIKKILK